MYQPPHDDMRPYQIHPSMPRRGGAIAPMHTLMSRPVAATGGALNPARLKWPAFIRAYAAQHKMSYWQAMTSGPEIKQLYKQQKYLPPTTA